jgi:hypothetical protein
MRPGTVTELNAIVPIKNQAELVFPRATAMIAQAMKPADALDPKSIQPDASLCDHPFVGLLFVDCVRRFIGLPQKLF